MTPRPRLRFERTVAAWSSPVRFAAALALVVATTALIGLINSGWGFLSRETIENPATLFIATVTLAVLFLGVGPALLTAAASMLAVFLFFSADESFERAIVLVATMLIVIGLAQWQRRAQMVAERAQAKFQAILESMADAVMVVDGAGRATDVNQAAIAMLGAPDRTQALAKIGRRRPDGTPFTDEYALLARAIAGEEVPQKDVHIPDESAAPRTVSAIASPIRDIRGRVIGAVSVSRDITDRLTQGEERERLLRQIEEEQRFTRHILASVPVGIAVVRADDYTVLSFNEEYDASIRHAPGSHPLAIERSLLDALPATSHEATTRLLSRAVREHATIRNTAYAAAVAPDRYYDGTIQPLQLGDGTPALLITSVNVTDRVQGEQERETLLTQVERQAAQLAATFEAIGDGIAVYDADGTVLHRNEAFYRLLRLEQGIAPPLWDAFIGEMHLRKADGTPMTREETHSFRALGGETIREEAVLVRDGLGQDRFMSQSAAPIRAADGAILGAVVVFNDVTERVAQEREREALLALVEERRRFTQAVFDAVPVSLAVVDTDGLTFSTANPAFIEGTHEPYRSRGVNGRALTTVLPHTQANGFADQLRTVGNTGEPFATSATEYHHPTRGTTYWNETMIPLIMNDPTAHHVLYIAADVTKEHEAQQRIASLAQEAAERASQLEAVFSALAEGLILTDVGGNIVRSNAAVARILALGGEPVPPLNTFGERFAMRDAEGIPIPQENRVTRAALGGETTPDQLRRFRNLRGEERWMSVSASPVRDETGVINGVAMTMRDVTDARHGIEERESLLREVEEGRRLAQAVIDSAPAGIVVFRTDPNFTVRLVNDQYLPLLDAPWRNQSIVGRPFHEFIPNAESSGVLPIFRRVMETGEPVTLREFEFEGFQRGTTYYDWSLVPLRESGNAVTGLLLLVIEVTDRVLSRQRIEELADAAAQRAAELEAIIANMPDGVTIHALDGRIMMENAASRRLTGRNLSGGAETLMEPDVLQTTSGTTMVSDELPSIRALHGEIVTDQVVVVRWPDTDEERFLMYSSAPVRANSGAITGAVAVFRDITEMKQLDQMKDEFISIAAHELRTPLTAIKGYAELMDRRLRAQEGREGDRRSLAVIRKQTERLANLVNEMLDVSRIEAGHLHLNTETFDLSIAVGEVVNNLRVSSETHTLSLAAEPGIEVEADAARIEQVLINLITNAITYSPDGGEIGVRVWMEGRSACVSVTDRGVGIAQEELPHLFDRFYRAPRAGVMRSGGMGLGLYICQEIVTRHGGTIDAESVPGTGSTFTFTLPLSGEGLRTEEETAG